MNPIDRRLVEALKKSPYVKIVFEFGHDEMLIEAKDKILSLLKLVARWGIWNKLFTLKPSVNSVMN